MAKGEGGGWRPAGGGTGPVRRGPKADWMPTEQKPKNRNRQFKIAGLSLLFLGLIVLLVFLYRMFTPPSPPVLLIISTDPAMDAADLQCPIDPYGWMSGKDLEKWSERHRSEAQSDVAQHAPLARNCKELLGNNETEVKAEDLAEWALRETHSSGILRKASETAILYFGLNTGADSDGAFVHINKRRKVHVGPLLELLSKKLGKTKVLVMFDPARQLPEPARGQLHDGFVDAMKSKAMDDLLATLGNITVILGCDSGERGWESEELRRTAFANAVILALGGEAQPSRDQKVTALDLYKSAYKTTEKWTLQNRPTTQHPVLLPAGEKGEQRAAETELMLHRPTKDVEAEPKDPLPGLKERWQEYGKLASANAPAPHVYAPRRWRRYRELLLRYEHAARAGEFDSIAALKSALIEEEAAIAAAQAAGFIDKAKTASVPMWQAKGLPLTVDSNLIGLGNKYVSSGTPEAMGAFEKEFNASQRMAYSNQMIVTLIQALAGDPAIKQPALELRAKLLRKMWDNEDVRPPDVQLFLMLNQFSRLHDPREQWPSDERNGTLLWQRAIHVRRRAEEAALGRVSGSHPYSEAIWRSVAAVVQNGDEFRRKAEDLLFAVERDRKAAFDMLAEAEKRYERAVKLADELREAFALRDRAMADLPYLCRWAMLEGEETFQPKPRELWETVHMLAKALDELPPDSFAEDPAVRKDYANVRNLVEKLKRGDAQVPGGFDALLDRYEDRFKAEAVRPVSLQDAWQTRETLLAVPPLRMKAAGASEMRGDIVVANRKATKSFIEKENLVGGKRDDDADKKRKTDEEIQRARSRKERAIAAGYLGLAELGKDLVDSQKKQELTSWQSINDEVNKITEGKWEAAASSGQNLARHYAYLATQPDLRAKDPKSAEIERFSRSAIAFGPRGGKEQAERNRDFRWQRLFTAQARRFVLDHWYDGEAVRTKYFDNVSESLIHDSDELKPPDPDRPGEKMLEHDTRTLLGAQFDEYEKLKKADVLRLEPIATGRSWTTEPRMEVEFKLTAGVLPPDPNAVTWADFDGNAKGRQIWIKDESKLRELRTLKPESTTLTTILNPPKEVRTVDENASIRRSVFFRGQSVTKDAPAHLSLMPDLIATHLRLQPEAPRVAFVGRNDVDLGAVTIVLDYSPSMTELAEGNKSGKPRIDRTWVELRKILKGLPKDTRLIVRGFGLEPVKPEQKVIKPREFESAITKGGIDREDKETKVPFPGTYDRPVFNEPVIVKWDEKNTEQFDEVMFRLEKAPRQMNGNNREGVNSPVVRTMLNSLEEDFKGTRPEQTKILIVLTDGGDNSCWDYEKGRVDPSPAIKALSKSLQESSAGIAVRMLLINDEDSTGRDREVTKAFAELVEPVLKTATPAGSVRVDKVEKLAEELRELLRPRVRLARDGKIVDDLPVYFDAPPPERPAWSEPLPDLGFESWVGQRSLRVPVQLLEFSRADRLLFKLNRRPDPALPAEFERVVWGSAKPFAEILADHKRIVEHPDRNWLLSVPMYRSAIGGYLGEGAPGSGAHTLDLLAAVEELRTLKGNPLKQPAPAFTWWALNSEGPHATPNAPVYLWREYGNPAPTWRIRRPGWSDAANQERLPKGRLDCWVGYGTLNPRSTTQLATVGVESATGGYEGNTWEGSWETAEATVRFSWEPQHPFVTHAGETAPDKVQGCLAVRVYSKNKDVQKLKDGKPAPYFIQVDGANLEEHQYFRGVGAYTGYFSLGPDATPESLKGRIVRIYAVADLVAPEKSNAFEFPLVSRSARGGDPVWDAWNGYAPTMPKPKK